MGNEWTCSPGEHNYQQFFREQGEPVRLFCTKCGWVRSLTDIVSGDPRASRPRHLGGDDSNDPIGPPPADGE